MVVSTPNTNINGGTATAEQISSSGETTSASGAAATGTAAPVLLTATSSDKLEEEEEETTSWRTSSTISLSPENPQYQAAATIRSETKTSANNKESSTLKKEDATVIKKTQQSLPESFVDTITTNQASPAIETATESANKSAEFVVAQSAAEDQEEEQPQALANSSSTTGLRRAKKQVRTIGTTADYNKTTQAPEDNCSNNEQGGTLLDHLAPTSIVASTKYQQHRHHQFPEDDRGEPVVDESILQGLMARVEEEEEDAHHEEGPVMLETHDDEKDHHLLLLQHDKPAGKTRSFLPQSFQGSSVKQQQPQPLLPIPLPPQSPGSRSVDASIGGETTVDALMKITNSQTKSENDEDDGYDDDFPRNSLLKIHHGRQPSTIMEEMSENNVKGPEDVAVEEVTPFLPSSKLSPGRITSPQSPQRHEPQQLLQHQQRDRSSSGSLTSSSSSSSSLRTLHARGDPLEFKPLFTVTRLIGKVSERVLPKQHVQFAGASTWIGFWALLHVTCANYVLTPMRDAIALQVGVEHMPNLTLASTVLALFSSVPIGWLFEAPDPSRRLLWKRMGLTRGETQGTSLALFYRMFALVLISYAIGFQWLEFMRNRNNNSDQQEDVQVWFLNLTKIWARFGQAMYIAFFLVVHLMKLHCLSLVWGVTTEAMEYEDVARKQHQKTLKMNSVQVESSKMRLKRLALVGFGGTVGGIFGSFLASTMAQTLRLPGLLLLASCLLEISAELSIELGRIMRKHWEGQQQLFASCNDLASLDASMRRSTSLGSMKRISSGNSLNRIKSTSDLANKTMSGAASAGNLSAMASAPSDPQQSDDTFRERMMRGITTILRSRLLMAIFTYNALYASTTVLLSFQRAALVANRSANTSVQADTAYLANINMASSAAIFVLQASGMGAYVAHKCGSRGTLTLMPLIRLLGVLALAWWHKVSGGAPPNLLVFLVVDECCKIMNLAVAKPVRESLWRGLSNEARYEAKPIVDTLANRWGGGSAAFFVSIVDKTLDLFGVVAAEDGVRNIFGFPPILFLCVFIASWWSVVSVDLGQIRRKIDLELKKRQ